LPEDLNKLVIINGEAACNAARNLSHLKRKIAIDLMKVSGIEIIVPQKADMENFRKAADIVHKEYEKKIGKEYLQKIYELTGYAPY
jgi:TRAP-type C4-dicarboxylate transport system substrate-binding protein